MLTVIQACQVIEKAMHMNRTVPDYNYSAFKKPKIVAIAISWILEYYYDNSLDTRKIVLNIFKDAYAIFEEEDLRSKSEKTFDYFILEDYILDDYEKINQELEYYCEHEYFYLQFITKHLPIKKIKYFDDEKLENLKNQGVLLERNSDQIVLLYKFTIKSDSDNMDVTLYPFAIMPNDLFHINSIAVSRNLGLKHIRTSIEELEMMFEEYPSSTIIDIDFSSIIYESTEWEDELLNFNFK